MRDVASRGMSWSSAIHAFEATRKRADVRKRSGEATRIFCGFSTPAKGASSRHRAGHWLPLAITFILLPKSTHPTQNARGWQLFPLLSCHANYLAPAKFTLGALKV